MMVCVAALTSTNARAESPAAYMQGVQNELMAAQRTGGVVAFSDVLRKHMDVPNIGPRALDRTRAYAAESRAAGLLLQPA